MMANSGPVVEQHRDEGEEERRQVQIGVINRVAVQAGSEEQGARHERVEGHLHGARRGVLRHVYAAS